MTPMIRRIAPTLLALVLIALFFRNQDLSRVVDALQQSRWDLVVIAALLNVFAITWIRAKRFSVLLEELPHSGQKPTFGELIRIMWATRALNSLLPALAGESLRMLQLKRRSGYSAASSAAAVAMEMVSEVLGFSLIAIVLLSIGIVDAGSKRFLYGFLILGFSSAVVALILGVRPRSNDGLSWEIGQRGNFRQKISEMVARFRVSLKLLHSPGVWIKAVGWTLLADVVDAAMVGLCLKAVGIHLGVSSWFLLLAGINLAIAVPAPGHIGTLEAGAVLVLLALGVNRAPASVFALLYHAAHLIPALFFGSLCLQLEFRTDLNVAQSPTESSPRRDRNPRRRYP